MGSHAEEVMEFKESPKYGMMTKYLRTVNYGDLRDDFEIPPLPKAAFRADLETQTTLDGLPDYCHTDVYLVHSSEAKADLYAWLSEYDIEMVRDSQAQELKSWMSCLDPQ